MNTDESFFNSFSSCGGLFRGDQRDFIYGFSDLMEGKYSLRAKLFGVIHDINIDFTFCWKKMWLERDLSLVISCFS